MARSLRDLWSKLPFVVRARRRAQAETQLAAAFEALPLSDADRVAAVLLHGAPLYDESHEVVRPSEPDAYTQTFLRAYAGRALGDLVITRAGDDTRRDDDPSARVVGEDEDGEYWVREGDRHVWADLESPVAPSVAHWLVGRVLDRAELAAFVADPRGWSPDPKRHPAPRHDVAHPPLTIDARSRAWARIGAPVVALLSSTLATVIVAAVWRGGRMSAGLSAARFSSA